MEWVSAASTYRVTSQPEANGSGYEHTLDPGLGRVQIPARKLSTGGQSPSLCKMGLRGVSSYKNSYYPGSRYVRKCPAQRSKGFLFVRAQSTGPHLPAEPRGRRRGRPARPAAATRSAAELTLPSCPPDVSAAARARAARRPVGPAQRRKGRRRHWGPTGSFRRRAAQRPTAPRPRAAPPDSWP